MSRLGQSGYAVLANDLLLTGEDRGEEEIEELEELGDFDDIGDSWRGDDVVDGGDGVALYEMLMPPV